MFRSWSFISCCGWKVVQPSQVGLKNQEQKVQHSDGGNVTTLLFRNAVKIRTGKNICRTGRERSFSLPVDKRDQTGLT